MASTGRRRIVGQIGPTAQVHDHAHERLVHGHVGRAVAADALFVAERLGQHLAERDAGILHRVVKIHLDVALGFEIEVEETMPGEEREHVIEKRDAGLHRWTCPCHRHSGGCLMLVSLVLRSMDASRGIRIGSVPRTRG